MKNQSGMTLVEITVATIVLSIVLLSAGTIYVAGAKELKRITEDARVQVEASLALDHMWQNLMGATGIDSPAIPLSNSNNIVVLTDDTDAVPKIKYELTGGAIKCYKKFGTPDQSEEKIANYITELKFNTPLSTETPPKRNYVTIDITAEKGRMKRSFTTGVVLRGMNP